MLPPSKQQEKSRDQCGFEDITNLQATKMTQSVSLMHTEGPWAVDEPKNKSGRQVRSSRSSGLSRASSVFSVHPTLILEPWRLLLASQEGAPAARKWVEPPWWRGLGCGNGDHLRLAARVWCYGFGSRYGTHCARLCWFHTSLNNQTRYDHVLSHLFTVFLRL